MIRYKISSLTGYLVQTPWPSLCYQTKSVGENKEVDKICCCVLLTRVNFKKIVAVDFINTCRNVMNDFDLRITEVSPRSGGAALIECWRAIFSTSCYPHIVPMMNRWLVKKIKNGLFYTYIFHSYLIINKNTEKGIYLVIQECFSSNIWYVTIFCEYPVSLKLVLLNILYPNNFFLKYPVSR